MMKVYPIWIVLFFSTLVACDMEPRSYSEEIEDMKDTVFHSFPTVNRVSVEVRTDFGKELHITLGDRQLYEAPEPKREKVVKELERISSYLFKGVHFRKGSVIFVAEENTLKVEEGTEKVYPMEIEVLSK